MELQKALDFVESPASKGVTLWDYTLYDESEYTDGTSFEIKLYNPTKKIIKYCWISLTGYNPVEDKIIDRKTGSSVVSV